MSGTLNAWGDTSKLKRLADACGVCLLLVHHTRKQQADDKFDMISGTNGLSGAADGAFLLQKEKRTDGTATLDVVGRDQQDQRLYLIKDKEHLTWTLERMETELWVEPPDPVLEAVAAFITAERPSWGGTATELAAALQVDKADQKNKEAAAAEKKAAQARAKLDDVAPLLKGMEKLAADFSDDSERTLPEAGPLESAKSYREKKAKPLWEKIVKVLRSVYRAYFDLKSRFERLQSAYDREVSKNGSLSTRIYEVCAERDGLKGQVRDYERVRRAIGPEQADKILEAVYQQEQAEKERKRAARPKMRVGAR